MNLLHSLRRTAWPLILLAIGIGAHLAHEPVFAALHLDVTTTPIRLLTGSLSYFAAAWLGGRLAGIALERTARKQRRVPKLLRELVSAVFFLVAFIATVMLVLGQSMTGALASSGLVLAVIGFAIRNVVADALSGIALGLEGPFRIGDWVDIDGVVRGRIIEIGWRTTRLLTRDSTYMILPNSQIARQKLTNYSAPQRHYRAQVQVLLDHETPVSQARKILASAAAKSKLILPKPLLDARVTAYEADGIVYAVRYWVSNFDKDVECRDSVLGEIDAALRAKNVPPPHKRIRWSGDQATPTAERWSSHEAGEPLSRALEGPKPKARECSAIRNPG